MLSHKPFIVVIGINTRRASTLRADEGLANTWAHENQAPPQDNQVPTLEDISATSLNLAQAMTSQDNAVTSQVQAMRTQVNREVGPHVPHHASIMSSRLRDFFRMNQSIFFR